MDDPKISEDSILLIPQGIAMQIVKFSKSNTYRIDAGGNAANFQNINLISLATERYRLHYGSTHISWFVSLVQ